MSIKKIKITNFKSFKNLEVELGNFNILIGANASGKSNFIQIFKFLRDITNDGLNNAISMQGGIEYLRNINIGSCEGLSVEIVSDQKYGRVAARGKETGLIGIQVYETVYKFAIKFKKKGRGFDIAEDKLTQKFDLVKLEIRKKEIEEKEKLGQGETILSNVNRKINIESLKLPQELPIKEDDVIPPFLKEEKLEPKTLLLVGRSSFFMPPLFSDISIYDFDPKIPKKATPITGKADLEEEGGNLAIVLKNIIENREKERKFSNLVRDLLPFVDNLDVEKFADKSLLFKLREVYTKRHYLPASLISDGTINITALIIALYFEDKPLTIIEEPERNIHPHLISKMINMMKDASIKKQIIVTTHNPEMVKNADLENILLVSRDKDGFSTISRPADKEEVKTFLKNEIGIEELYVQNLLEV
jgi:predicted ATPase